VSDKKRFKLADVKQVGTDGVSVQTYQAA